MRRKDRLTFIRLAERTIELVLFALTVTIIGTLGYMKIEGTSFIDSFYMTVITMAAVGYREIFPLSTLGRIWTSILIFFGITTVAIWVAIVATYLFESDTPIVRLVINRKNKKK